MRLIDADALLDDAMDRYCKECDKRKGIKNGKYRIIYDIGEAPCRACEVDDMKAELEDAPTVDAEQVIRCKDCKHWNGEAHDGFYYFEECALSGLDALSDDYCSRAERKEE